MAHVGGFIFLLFLLIVLVALAFVGYIVFRQYQARQAGLSPPSFKSFIPFVNGNAVSATNYPTPRSSGPFEWIKDQFESLSGRLRQGRSARGAYEETGSGADGASAGTNLNAPYSGARRGRGGEDDAWDSRFGGARGDLDEEEAYGTGPGGYYEEQELGLTPTPGLHTEPYGGASDHVTADSRHAGPPVDDRGRSKSREPPQTLGNKSAPTGENPFGDHNEAPSLRSVSPRPEADAATHHKDTLGSPKSVKSGGDSPTSHRRSMFREGL